MELIWDGTAEAIALLLSANPQVLEIAVLSLEVSGLATLVALVFGVPMGALLAFKVFPGRRFTVSLINTGMVGGRWSGLKHCRGCPTGFSPGEADFRRCGSENS